MDPGPQLPPLIKQRPVLILQSYRGIIRLLQILAVAGETTGVLNASEKETRRAFDKETRGFPSALIRFWLPGQELP